MFQRTEKEPIYRKDAKTLRKHERYGFLGHCQPLRLCVLAVRKGFKMVFAN
jgi:hypothetical protein